MWESRKQSIPLNHISRKTFPVAQSFVPHFIKVYSWGMFTVALKYVAVIESITSMLVGVVVCVVVFLLHIFAVDSSNMACNFRIELWQQVSKIGNFHKTSTKQIVFFFSSHLFSRVGSTSSYCKLHHCCSMPTSSMV